jgi:hypothetical protein
MIRRALGYGVGFGTAYLRLKHNAHWGRSPSPPAGSRVLPYLT